MRRIREEEAGSRSERREVQSIANFISQIEWAKEAGEGRGITWLELYIWFRMHSPKIDVDPLGPTKPLLNDITVFKRRVRRVATYCINEEQEWVLNTSHARENRLKEAAIGNKHAAIQGMPNISKDEAKHIMNTILEMKGARTKKQRIAHEEGSLALIRKPLTFRGTAKHWHKDMAKHANWTIDDINGTTHEVEQKSLRNVICPQCLKPTSSRDMKLKVNSNFSNLKCPKCKETNSSRKWLCECVLLWYKCAVHCRFTNSHECKPKRRRKVKCSERGLDIPLPKFRKQSHQAFFEPIERREWGPPPGSKLAVRFPHLVKGAAPT